jgi:20S proteasome subunit beta 1
MARDGSSGGVVRLMNITKDKEEREFIDYNDLPNKM